MGRDTSKYFDIEEVVKMAAQYGVENNAFFLQALKNYDTIQKAIASIDDSLDEDEMMVTKEYVKGRENLYLNPAIKELPKLSDAANKTMASMIAIIKEFGSIKETDEFLDFIDS